MGPIKFLYTSKFDFTAKSIVTNTVVRARVLCNSVKVNELPPVWESLSSVILLFVKMRLSIFPFGVSDWLWVLIWPVPGVS